MTVTWHVEDLKVLHKHKLRIDEFEMWCEKNYVYVKKQRGKVIDYLGMTLDYSTKGQVKILME